MAAASRMGHSWSPLYACQIRTPSIRAPALPMRLAVGAAIRSPGRLAAAVNRAEARSTVSVEGHLARARARFAMATGPPKKNAYAEESFLLCCVFSATSQHITLSDLDATGDNYCVMKWLPHINFTMVWRSS